MKYRVEMKLHKENDPDGATNMLYQEIELRDNFVGDIGIATRMDGCTTRMVKCITVIPEPKPEPETKPCMFCGKKLESMFDDWADMQPDGGGEVQIICAFGSKHDQRDQKPINLVICDTCIEEEL
jgi:hypothetical protein